MDGKYFQVWFGLFYVLELRSRLTGLFARLTLLLTTDLPTTFFVIYSSDTESDSLDRLSEMRLAADTYLRNLVF